jgi:hypothetical protein
MIGYVLILLLYYHILIQLLSLSIYRVPIYRVHSSVQSQHPMIERALIPK